MILDILNPESEENLFWMKLALLEAKKSFSLNEDDFKIFQSWGDISKVKDFDSMPQSLKNYIQYIEEYLEIPIKIISLGPERNQTIIR